MLLTVWSQQCELRLSNLFVIKALAPKYLTSDMLKPLPTSWSVIFEPFFISPVAKSPAKRLVLDTFRQRFAFSPDVNLISLFEYPGLSDGKLILSTCHGLLGKVVLIDIFFIPFTHTVLLHPAFLGAAPGLASLLDKALPFGTKLL